MHALQSRKALQAIARPRTACLAFVRQDDACSRESREAGGPQLLRFHLRESSFLDQSNQIVYVAPPGMKARCSTCSVLLVREIGDDQAPPAFEHAGDFRQTLPFEGSR